MKSLLGILAAVGMLWGCYVEQPRGQSKGWKEDWDAAAASNDPKDWVKLIRRPDDMVGKYYSGIKGVAVAYKNRKKSFHITSSIKEFYYEFDLSGDKPMLNIKYEDRPNHCDQIPIDNFKFDANNTDWAYGETDDDFVNDRGHRIAVSVGADRLIRKVGNQRLELWVHIEQEMVADRGVKEPVIYFHKVTLYPERYKFIMNDLNHQAHKKVEMKKIKKQFGSGDNCGKSSSGESDS